MISAPEGPPFRRRRPGRERGFTLLEAVIAVAIIGVMTALFYPSVRNSFEMRGFDNAGRDILTTLQTAKWLAVGSKNFHRVRFAADSGGWTYRVEVEKPYGTWTLKAGQSVKRIPSDYGVTLTLPADLSVVFNGTGFVSNFDAAKNQISISSSKLGLLGESNLRTIRFYISGSTQFIKGTTG